MPGVYISYPFCAQKCSYCNFASDVQPRDLEPRYVAALHAELEAMQWPWTPETVFLGGGTPSRMDPRDLADLLALIPGGSSHQSWIEATIEAAPGSITQAKAEAWRAAGINRVSLGVQSFIDAEAAAVGRLHKRSVVLEDIAHLREAGIANINIDLIAGLPHQTAETWQQSLDQTLATGAPHASVYMLEVDEDSRLGREVIAGGTRYHAHFVPDDEATADFYLTACEQLNAAGITQYEISNFARAGSESRHNLKYWTRQPYLGFGVDAHSMLKLATPKFSTLKSATLKSATPDADAIRFAAADVLEKYVAGSPVQSTIVSRVAALEESFFLGLRLNRGVNLREIAATFGQPALDNLSPAISELVSGGLLQRAGESISLTSRGRLLSNEVFQCFLAAPVKSNASPN